MRVIQGVLVLVLLNLTWIITTSASCESETFLNGISHCVVKCGWGDKVCECPSFFKECEFNLVVQEIKTLTSYHVLGAKPDQVLGPTATGYNFDNVTGEPVAIKDGTSCSNYSDTSTFNCIEPNWVDGRNFKVAITINGVIPAPTIIMNQNSTLIAHVTNKLISEGTSIHWHGIEQFNTPWMDGVGGITQCSIEHGTTFTHVFLTTIPGTFWYHSHTGSQRADGLFGALVIRENEETLAQVNTALSDFGVGSFLDYPERHTIVLSDWFKASGIDNARHIGFYESVPIHELPTKDDQGYSTTNILSGDSEGSFPYFSSLINGLGREETVPYIQSRLSQFTVKQGDLYRFRLVGAQSLYTLKFSIDGHSLITVATDSYFIEPIEEVDFIILQSGERYDFLLNATAAISNYIIRLETLEAETDCTANAPFPSLNHSTEAILHYETAPWDNGIPSTAYQSISQSSPRRDCTTGPRCNAVNCPFQNFHSSYGIDCINVASFKLLIDTPADLLPTAYPSENHLFFLNFNFEGVGFSGSINGRNFALPSYPPLVKRSKYDQYSKKCDTSQDCSTEQTSCICAHSIELEFNKTVQMVVSAAGPFAAAHPLHIHGHTFQVLKIGYPTYYENNAYIDEHNQDINCGTQQPNATGRNCGFGSDSCTDPSWSQPTPELNISAKTPRKDTVIIPAGGYVVVNFISNNPGIWFLHCHKEPHQLQGMSMYIDEAKGRQNPAPDELAACENYIFKSEEFYELLQFDADAPSYATSIQVSIWLLVLMLTVFLYF